ncbi:MAG: aminopeptidase P family N-terminal domain-containing protein [Actinobacteria bacterium]|nr:aminopeptidase P family N-terminal domain-containing protein [Actinomycetota bacterium]
MPVVELTLPPLNDPGAEPALSEGVYRARLESLRRRLRESGLDAALVYADREHYANVSYLTGFDPRFEEALLVVPAEGEPVAIAGNESLSFLERAGLPLEGVLCQSFSLPGQDRAVRARLTEALAEAGLPRSARCGIAGWKPIPRREAPDAPLALAVAQFVLVEIESYLDAPVVDATDLLMGLDGLRALNEADQIAVFEHRAVRASSAVWRALGALAPGVTERDVARAMELDASPLAAHVMCTSARAGLNGLASPTDRVVEAGDWFSTAVGLWGALSCRAGLVAGRDDPRVEEFVEGFAEPYFGAVAAWYGSIGIGVTGGAVERAVADALAPSDVRLLLNPGHLIHLDEWLDSPFVPDGEAVLRSGMAVQCDLIPTSASFADAAANVEDGVALADGELRAELRERFPELWGRVERRRRLMIDELGLELADEVLPLSERAGVLPAGLLSLHAAVTA